MTSAVDDPPAMELQPPIDVPTTEDNETLDIKVAHHGTQYTYNLPRTSTLADLTRAIEEHLLIPPSDQKFLISKLGLLKPPLPDPSPDLSTLLPRKIQLLAPTPADLASLAAPAPRASLVKSARPAKMRNHQRTHDDITYTFHKLLPLPYLPDPSRSLRYLERLRDDAGIRAAMRTHKFSVPVLTEMNPAEHTTHESRTLGLNRNRGEVIELRLRTDAYDGYRDYKTIRKTLCHELAHNVFGEHDRDFWDLTRKIEGEVEKGDWRAGGRSVGEEEFYNPDDEGMGEHVDGGGWSGGEFVLGKGKDTAGIEEAGLSRREVLARAAEERMKRQTEQKNIRGAGGGSETKH